MRVVKNAQRPGPIYSRDPAALRGDETRPAELTLAVATIAMLAAIVAAEHPKSAQRDARRRNDDGIARTSGRDATSHDAKRRSAGAAPNRRSNAVHSWRLGLVFALKAPLSEPTCAIRQSETAKKRLFIRLEL
jgi:hypothetical protein